MSANEVGQRITSVMTHTLKCWPLFFEEVLIGKKRFEVRFNDRAYGAGDFIVLQEYVVDGDGGKYTGRRVQRQIEHVYDHYSVDGLMPGYVILSLSSGFYS